MIKQMAALALGCMILLPQIADARGWSWRQLGTTDTLEQCQAKARTVLSSVSNLQMDTQKDGVTAYGLDGIDVDGVISCGRGSDGRYVAVLILHSWDGGKLNQRRLDMIGQLRGYW